jgi:hypothetical protein
MHRMRVMDVEGKGRKELVCSPLHGRGTKDSSGPGASLFILRRPEDPFTGKWTREIIADDIHINHNVWPLDWDGDGKEEMVSAGFEGVFVLKRGADGKWSKTKIGDGDPVKKGAGEVKIGRLPGGKRYVVTAEPWRAIPPWSTSSPKADQPWRRQVLVENHKGCHAVWTADLAGSKVDSAVVGFRGVPEGKKDECVVYVFHPLDAAGEKWEKKVLDDKGMGSEDAICADLNGDGKVDIVAVGRSTKNVKIYWVANSARARRGVIVLATRVPVPRGSHRNPERRAGLQLLPGRHQRRRQDGHRPRHREQGPDPVVRESHVEATRHHLRRQAARADHALRRRRRRQDRDHRGRRLDHGRHAHERIGLAAQAPRRPRPAVDADPDRQGAVDAPPGGGPAQRQEGAARRVPDGRGTKGRGLEERPRRADVLLRPDGDPFKGPWKREPISTTFTRSTGSRRSTGTAAATRRSWRRRSKASTSSAALRRAAGTSTSSRKEIRKRPDRAK